MSRAARAAQATYRLFGHTLVSDFAFANRLAAGSGPPDLTFTCASQSPLPGGRGHPVYATAARAAGGESLFSFHRLGDCDLLHFAHVADFCLWPERILCHPLEPAYEYLIELDLLGGVLSTWLERRGIPALHASAVEVHGQAVAFLSGNGGGKSALAAAFMQAGHPLLTDDVLPIARRAERFVGHAGYPTMRMWPDEAQHFVGRYEDLDLVHPALTKRRVHVGPGGFGDFCTESLPLAVIYLPERREGATGVEIEPVSPAEAVIELVRHSFVAYLVEALGWQPRRLDLFAQLVRHVPLRRLVYPGGLGRLPSVVETILQDMAGRGGRPGRSGSDLWRRSGGEALAGPGPLIDSRHAEHRPLVKGAAHDLQADGQPLLVEPAR